ncbi:MAG: glycoside hydrolase family 2 TIM barrel-domain containing protein [Lachnospiraceae bacterium]|nr:glycoside hydrolase family 2 TIM barrel-domain containing protein [Lachnospiraceae bacterium]
MFHGIFDRKTVSLNGLWNYRIDQNDTGRRQSWYLKENLQTGWKDITVPDNWYMIDEIGDYFGVIWYKREFTVPAEMKEERIFIRFEGVDYITEVWLNGKYFGFHEGMFNPFEFEITDVVNLEGDNTLVVRDYAPKDTTEYIEADNDETPLSDAYKFHQSKGITQIKGHMIEAMHRPGCYSEHRMDGNSGGIWGNVSLVSRAETYIENVKIYTKINTKRDGREYDKNAVAAFDVFINCGCNTKKEMDVTVSISPYNFEQDIDCTVTRKVQIKPGENQVKITALIQDVRLWWTWDHGKPNMYTASVSVSEDKISTNFGVKEIYQDEKGQWYLNNKHIFLRGMRYISSLWMSEANEDMWNADFDKMLDMDINSIRIGSHIEKEGVYKICDEKGLLLWQVFALHYCISDADDVISRASDMIRDMGYMLTNHACMGMWSVYKEPEIYGLEDKPNTYFKLCDILKDTLGQVDADRWIHKGDYREGVQNIMIGSCQDGDMDVHEEIIKPNIVEFGADSVPCVESLVKYIPQDKLWPPDWDVWQYWGLFYYNQFRRAKVEMGDSLEDFINNTQKYEALVVKEQIEMLRQRKYTPVCTMYLYYWSDACPLMGSGLFDYYREPYQVYESMKSVYTEVLISLEWNEEPHVIGRDKKYVRGDQFIGKVWATNDHFHTVNQAMISWSIQRADGTEVESKKFVTNLKEDCAEVVDTIEWIIPEDYVGEYTIHMSIEDSQGKVLSKNSIVIMATE